MADIYLVRHGQASFGSADYDQLSPLGEQQSEWLGAYFAERGLRFDEVVTGTQRRHQQTAQGIFRGAGTTPPIRQDPGLNEYDFAQIYRALGDDTDAVPADPAEKRRYFYRRLKQALQRWSQDDLPGPLPETWRDFQARVAAAMQTVQRSQAKRILVVSSGGTMGIIAQQIMEAPAHTAIELNLQIRNTGLCQLYFNEHTMRMVTFNTIPHLDQPDRLSAITFA